MSSNSGADDNRSSLSRNALYAPLVAYEQQTVDPSAYMLQRKNVPSSIRDSSLIQFLQSLGELSTREVQDRIQQRALTLVGGGINSRFKKPRERRGDVVVVVLSNRQRKRIVTSQTKQQRQQQQGIASSGENDKKDALFNLLLAWNAQWNTYVRNKLATREELSDASVLSQKLASHLELAGAFVRITECCAHKQWVGREGMIVETTVNTWRVAWIRGNSSSAPPKLLVVPKHGSQVAFSIRQDNNNNNNKRVTTVVIHG